MDGEETDAPRTSKMHERECCSPHREQCIERTCKFADDFFLRVFVIFLQYSRLLCTVNDEKTIECSGDFDTALGKEGAQLCIVRKGSVLVSETFIRGNAGIEEKQWVGAAASPASSVLWLTPKKSGSTFLKDYRKKFLS